VNAVKVEQKFGGAEATTSVIPSSSARDDTATAEQHSVEVTSEPSAVTPAADAQPTSPAQEDVTSGVSSDAQAPAAEVAVNSEAPAAEVTIVGEVSSAEDATIAQSQEQSAANNVGSEQTASVPETQDSAVQEPSPVAVQAEEVKETSSAAPAQASNEPSESSTASGPAKSESVAAENKPATGPADGKSGVSFAHLHQRFPTFYVMRTTDCLKTMLRPIRLMYRYNIV